MSVDYRPLFTPVSREEVAQFKQVSRATGQPWAHAASAVTILTVLVGVVAAVVVGGVFVTSLPIAFASFSSAGTAALAPFIIAPLLIVAIGGYATYQYFRQTTGRWESLLRRTRFASANQLTYSTGVKNPAYPGLIFSHGDSRQTSDNYQSVAGPQFDLGNYRYTTGSGKEKKTHTWGYLALRLERKLPHMVLDARGNNGILGGSTLPTSFRRDQKLSLEGDFDKYFTLYCPREYERDALYVFTPDLMALLIDEGAAFDVEIVDDWMFVYSVQPFALDEAKTVHRLFSIIETIGVKMLRQTDRYADERIGDSTIDLVAPRGQRLKKGTTVASIGIFVVFAWVAVSFARAWF
ncbi:MAG TPA: hypothetical protein VFT01_08990 [Homoserinimonas sp.]|nr:hypothetical protein [Homoserinimonas sp.]